MKFAKLHVRKSAYALGALSLLLLASLIFQNCSPTSFGVVPLGASTLASLSTQAFSTPEDVPLVAQPKTFASVSSNKSAFTITKQPLHGVLTSFDISTAKFTYLPNKKFFGDDSFEYKEKEGGVVEPHIMPVSITVVMNNEAPVITTDSIGFEMNKADTLFSLVVTDYNDPEPTAYLSADKSLMQVQTKNGVLKYISANRFSYTPNVNYRGMDQYEFWSVNAYGKIGIKIIYLNVENPFSNLEPSMAVRGMGCVACHMNSTSTVITDFGAGDNAFFGKNALAAGADPFSAPYSFYNDNGGNAFSTASLKQIMVPDIMLPFSLTSYSLSEPQKAATTIQQYVDSVRGSAMVTVKSQIYIGAPSASTLLSRTRLGTKTYDYSKNQDSSPDLVGVQSKGNYFESSTLTCDGDLTINGALFLNNLALKTNNGCRIYATGPIFINGNITYSQATVGTPNNTNLQLVSAVWINLGVGLSHCESAAGYPATSATNLTWYKDNSLSSPFDMRMRKYSVYSRNGQQDPSTLSTIQQGIAGFADASCRKSTNGELPRQVHFSRLLLNAPRIDSRYTGQFDGVLIAETALMSLSNFSFSFDPVFSRVPVLPLLLPSDYLIVK